MKSSQKLYLPLLKISKGLCENILNKKLLIIKLFLTSNSVFLKVEYLLLGCLQNGRYLVQLQNIFSLLISTL